MGHIVLGPTVLFSVLPNSLLDIHSGLNFLCIENSYNSRFCRSFWPNAMRKLILNLSGGRQIKSL